jgi:hypothetical protein
VLIRSKISYGNCAYGTWVPASSECSGARVLFYDGFTTCQANACVHDSGMCLFAASATALPCIHHPLPNLTRPVVTVKPTKMARFLQQPAEAVVALAVTDTAIDHVGSHMKPAMQTALVQAGNLTTTTAEHMEPVLAHVKEIAQQVWDVGAVLNGTNGTSLQAILEPALKLLTPVCDYIVKHPWVLIPVLVPALDAWLLVMGFGVEGIVAGKIVSGVFLEKGFTKVCVNQALSRRHSKPASAMSPRDPCSPSCRATEPEALRVLHSAWLPCGF